MNILFETPDGLARKIQAFVNSLVLSANANNAQLDVITMSIRCESVEPSMIFTLVGQDFEVITQAQKVEAFLIESASAQAAEIDPLAGTFKLLKFCGDVPFNMSLLSN